MTDATTTLPLTAPADTRRPHPWSWAVIALLTSVQLITLRTTGQPWWCSCGTYWPWGYPTQSMHNSQHGFDLYSLSHLLHGVIFFFPIVWLLPKLLRVWRLCVAVAIESAWEILENSPIVIERYRNGTSALGYSGDSILNSLGDTLSMIAGFLIAQRIGLKGSIVLYVVLELFMLWWIRDNLTLNVIMLVSPIDAIKRWQMNG
jgi:hypothetical protein